MRFDLEYTAQEVHGSEEAELNVGSLGLGGWDVAYGTPSISISTCGDRFSRRPKCDSPGNADTALPMDVG